MPLFACKDKSKEKEDLHNPEQQISSEIEDYRIGRHNYAVVWKWVTTDKALMKENLVSTYKLRPIGVFWLSKYKDNQ